MLAINFLWTHPHRDLPGLLNAFADNWSYATTQHEQHRLVLGTIVEVANALKLTIDWQKTWGWATSQQHKDVLQRVQSELCPEAHVLQMATHARELGYIMHYKCHPSRATHQIRHQEALIRLKKLQRQDLPLDIKAQIARASCLVKAFFGAELYATGERIFSEIRTGISPALLGDHHNIQTHVACTCLSKYVEDPELFVIKQAVKKARHYLRHATTDDFEKFIMVVTQFRHGLSQIIGPAASLQFYLAKSGFQCDQQGRIAVGAFTNLHLCDSNLEDSLMFIDDAWMENVSLALHSRKGCRFTPQIDPLLTLNLFNLLVFLKNKKLHHRRPQTVAQITHKIPETSPDHRHGSWKTRWETRPETRETQDQGGGHSNPATHKQQNDKRRAPGRLVHTFLHKP